MNGRPFLEKVLHEDEAATRCMRSQRSPDVGDWVVVAKGLYQDDLGCVLAKHKWGFDVLVVPRFIKWEYMLRPTHNVKRSQTEHLLWHSDIGQHRFGSHIQVRSITKLTGSGKDNYHHGLLVLECDDRSLLPATSPPLEILVLFSLSCHPIVLATKHTVPCPHEWQFTVGEVVEVVDGSSEKRLGKIQEVHTHWLEIALNDGSGTHRCSFFEVMKMFSIGDFVHSVEGWEGFTHDVASSHVTLLQMHEDGHFEVCYHR